MLVLALITFYPFWHVIMASFSDPMKLNAHTGVLLLPDGYSLSAYDTVLNYRLIYSGYVNTVIIVIVGTIINVGFTTVAAYVISRKRFALRKPISIFIIFTMYFSGGLIPSYLLINNILHLSNTYWALILPGAISTWNLLVMRTAFLGVPASLEESAFLDGANDFVVLYRIIVPNIMSTVAVIILFYAVGHWNSWFPAAIYMRERSMYPLQLVLREIIILSNMEMFADAIEVEDVENLGITIKYATILVATLPVLIVYPFLQRYFVKGVMVGAVKG
ncbi:MAG: carbohydrate ABC transporter permease [Christensenellales bacterium]